jgi:hypothetical protein
LGAVFLAALILLAFSTGETRPDAALAAPPNDDFVNAITITTPSVSGIVDSGENVSASTELSEPLNCGAGGKTVWYNWTSPASPGTVVLDTFGSNFDTALAIYTGSAVDALALSGCNDDFQPGGSGRQSALALNYAANTTYRIQVAGFFTHSGNFVLNLVTGAEIIVNTNADNITSDGVLTLREAMLLARGGTGVGGLNRVLNAAGETAAVLNAAAAGAGGSDVIHFLSGTFLPATPLTIPLTGSALPNLNATGDSVSAIGAGVIVDGQSIWDCFTISGGSNRIEGIRMIRCSSFGVSINGPGNTVGGSLAVQRNVIAQNIWTEGVRVSGGTAIGNVIKGNYIGTTADGTAASAIASGIVLFSGSQGTIVGGTGPGDGNLISGATAAGLMAGIYIVDSDFNVIRGNKIGTNAAGTGGIPNGIGVNVGAGAQGNVIGGVGQGEGNTIAFNTSSGVGLGGDATASVRGNSIHTNGGAGIASTIAPPIITTALGGTIAGTACALCIVDVYDDSSDEGRIYRTSTTADANGNFSISGVQHTLANHTATNTNSSGLTSWFSTAIASALNADGDGPPDTIDGCPLVAEDLDGFQDGDGCPDTDNDLDGVPDSTDDGRYVWQNPLGGTVDCRNVAEDIDGFHDDDGCPEPDNDYDTFPDHADDCPGADSNTGADGIADTGDEPTYPPHYLAPYKSREDFDAIMDTDGCHDSPGDDWDDDGLTDEDEVLLVGSNPIDPDTDADGITDNPDNCPTFANPSQNLPTWVVPAGDGDCDGFTKAREEYMGTNAAQRCAATTTSNDEVVDSWPSDFNDNRLTSLADVVLMGVAYNQPTGTDPAKKRFDLNASGVVSLADVVSMGSFYNKSCG